MEISTPLVIAWLVFGVAGLYVFRGGRRNANMTHVILGIALMVYPYAVTTAFLNWVIGLALMLMVYLTR